MDFQRLRVLCISVEAAGHVNPLIGLGSKLVERGHEVTIATGRSFTGKFVQLGFKEEMYDEAEATSAGKEPGKLLAELIQALSSEFRKEHRDKVLDIDTYSHFVNCIKFNNDRIAQIIEKSNPDVIIYEHPLWHPAVLKAKVPFVQLLAANPLVCLECDDLPPATLGFSLGSCPKEWAVYRKKRNDAQQSSLDMYTAYLAPLGVPLPKRSRYGYISANLNIFVYPQTLAEDYMKQSPWAKYWIGIDHALRPVDQTFTMPKKLMSLPGRLVYLSMGSTGSLDVKLMKTLVSYLKGSKDKYKFIVVKGQLHDQYELADNMWGEAFMPQLGVLPLVDLAIIHGGNNGFVETLYFGKPMIVVPLFSDQPDNAQRALDAKLGGVFNPFKQTGEELVQLMDEVLNNEAIFRNVQTISRQLQTSKSMDRAADKVEEVARNPKLPGVLVRDP